MIKKNLITKLVTVMTASIMASCSDGAPEVTADTSGRPVKLITIAGASDESSTRYPAVIAAGDSTDLQFVNGGTISALPVTESGKVVAGDLIARLDTRDVQSNLTSAQASFANAEDEYQRAVRLVEQDAIAVSVVEQRKTQRDVAKSQLETAQKAIADSELRAPFDGVIASVPVSEGDAVGAGEIIATLIGIETLDAKINIPASVISQAQSRENQSSTVILEAAPNREIAATFSEANLLADATSQTYGVTFTFKAPEGLLVLPGMNATVVLKSTGAGELTSVSVPLAAVQSDGNGQYVWLVNSETMTVFRQAVDVEPGIGETAVISSGVSAGDLVVGAGGAYLAEGVRVTPWTDQ